MCLSKLKVNQNAIIQKINLKDIDKRRVMDLGLVNGEIVKLLFSGPFGEPKAIEVLDTIISLRKEERDLIEVKLID